MPFIIGTAGHIDHGKTSLVKALTGQDTDRLKEEKERGITIALGFAHLDLPDGTRAGVIDVPGHERFVRHMLAGAHGLDLVLFTVAADDGVMPQTREHLDIVHLLGVRRGVWVITKADLVTASRIREVEGAIRALAAGTTLGDAPVLTFSCIDGRGLDSLRACIADVARDSARSRSHGYFRLPVDRVFTMRGHGVVVTGTAISGAIELGANVRCLPGGSGARVRQMQVHGLPAQSATDGQRVALNLAGADVAAIERGHVIVDERLTRVSNRFDAWLELRANAGHDLENHQRVRVHVAAAETAGRIRLLDRNDLHPRDEAYCQVILDTPLHVMRGDRFVVRDETARHTLGGGMIVDPWPRRHRIVDRRVAIERLRVLHRGASAQVIETYLAMDGRFAVPARTLSEMMNEPLIEEQLRQMPSVRVLDAEQVCVLQSRWKALGVQIEHTLADFHAAHPLVPGMDGEVLRDAVARRDVHPRVFRAVIDDLQACGLVAREAHALRLSKHRAQASSRDQAALDAIVRLLRANPVMPPDVEGLRHELQLERTKLVELLKVLEREHTVVRVNADLYFSSECIEHVRELVRKQWNANQDITPAAFRDAVGTTRKYAIPLLEYFDRAGITFRRGDSRRLRAGEPHGRQAHTT